MPSNVRRPEFRLRRLAAAIVVVFSSRLAATAWLSPRVPNLRVPHCAAPDRPSRRLEHLVRWAAEKKKKPSGFGAPSPPPKPAASPVKVEPKPVVISDAPVKAEKVESKPGVVSDAPVTDYARPGQVLPVMTYPHPALRRPNAKVTEFDEKLKILADNLFRTMYANEDNVGLAAPQVGVNLRVMVYNFKREGPDIDKTGEVVFVNPLIVSRTKRTIEFPEGCMSFADIEGDVTRPVKIEVQYQDLNGDVHRRKLDEVESRLFQHEYDHLDGVVFVDRMTPEVRATVQKKLDKLVELYKAGGGKEPRL